MSSKATNKPSTRSAGRRIAYSLASLAVAGAALGMTSAPASADAGRPAHPSVTSTTALKPGEHLPATDLSATALAAESCTVPGAADDSVLQTLKSTADARGVSSTVRLAMFETAWVESHANSLPCGDRDSAGVFQQRPSAGWGSASQVQTPSYAATKFLDGNDAGGAIAAAQAHPTWTAGQISQAVQASAYPDRYDEQQSKAEALITRAAQLGSGDIAAGHYSWPEVQYGEHNNRVQTVQLLLNRHGYGLAVDGIWGSATENAVEDFQTKSGLSSDGIVGTNTWGKLIVNLAPGSTGDADKALQHELQVHGYHLTVTGSYDSVTTKAVQAFRSGHHLPAGTSTDSAVWNTLIALKR